jgi:hypothetical protein
MRGKQTEDFGTLNDDLQIETGHQGVCWRDIMTRPVEISNKESLPSYGAGSCYHTCPALSAQLLEQERTIDKVVKSNKTRDSVPYTRLLRRLQRRVSLSTRMSLKVRQL